MTRAREEIARRKASFSWRTQNKGTVRLADMTSRHVFFSMRYLNQKTVDKGSRLFDMTPRIRPRGQNGMTFLIFLDELLERENLERRWVPEMIGVMRSALETTFVRRLGELIERRPPAPPQRIVVGAEMSQAQWRHEFLNELWRQFPPRPGLRGREFTSAIIDELVMPEIQPWQRQVLEQIERLSVSQGPPDHPNCRSTVVPIDLADRIQTRVFDPETGGLTGEIQELARRSGISHSDMIDALSYTMTASPQTKAALKKDIQEQLELEDRAQKEVEDLIQVGRRRIVIDEEEK